MELFLGERDIAAGGLDVGVAEQLLDRAQGCPRLDHVGRHCVPQRVRRGVLDPGDRQILVKQVLDGPRRERLVVLGQEEGRRFRRRPDGEVGPQRATRPAVQGQPAVLAALALPDPELAELTALL